MRREHPQRAPNGVADLMRIAVALEPDASTVWTAAELLGLRSAAATAAAPVVPRSSPHDRVRDEIDIPMDPGPGFPRASPPGGDDLPLTAMPLPAPAAGYRAPRNLDELLETGSAPPLADGLFDDRGRRALTRTVAGATACIGEVDVVDCVRRLAIRRPLRDLPRLPVLSTAGSIDLLLDAGIGMSPYGDDLRELPDAVRREVGPDSLKVSWFEDAPMLTRRQRDSIAAGEPPYRLPTAGTRILVVTTFGICGAAPAAAVVLEGWRRFVAAAQRAGVPIVALCPLDRTRRPRRLPRALPVVTWDHGTDIRSVRRAVQHAAVR